jgi:hypothetical protein
MTTENTIAIAIETTKGPLINALLITKMSSSIPSIPQHWQAIAKRSHMVVVKMIQPMESCWPTSSSTTGQLSSRCVRMTGSRENWDRSPKTDVAWSTKERPHATS